VGAKTVMIPLFKKGKEGRKHEVVKYDVIKIAPSRLITGPIVLF